MTVFDPDNSFRVEETADTIDVVWGNQVVLAIPPVYADQIVPPLAEAHLNSKGWETLDVCPADLQHGDRLPGLNITVDYCLPIGTSHRYELAVWADGACVLVFRDPEHKIKVERKIQ